LFHFNLFYTFTHLHIYTSTHPGNTHPDLWIKDINKNKAGPALNQFKLID